MLRREKARKIALEFQDMMKQKKPELLDSWIEDALKSEVENLKRFAEGLQQDYDAVKAALTLTWSNGQRRPNNPAEDNQAPDVRKGRV